MRTFLKKCTACETYTLLEQCVKCGQMATNPAPARFSPEDHYGAYRRKLKRETKGHKNG